LKTVKHIFSAYSKWIWGLLAPLGAWGVFFAAAIDEAFLGLPIDAIVAAYIYRNPHGFWIYILLASVGSALGGIIIYVIGYTGGEVLLRKRLSPPRFAKIHASFEKHEFLALMFPAMLPPPFPFKAIMLAAAVFEMSLARFLLAIFAGRLLRFILVGFLTLRFGPQIVSLLMRVFAHHFKWVLIAAAAGLFIWLLWRKKRAARTTPLNPEGIANASLRGEGN
jgi:membrane protein YqaA with SNARE-associated domain